MCWYSGYIGLSGFWTVLSRCGTILISPFRFFLQFIGTMLLALFFLSLENKQQCVVLMLSLHILFRKYRTFCTSVDIFRLFLYSPFISFVCFWLVRWSVCVCMCRSTDCAMFDGVPQAIDSAAAAASLQHLHVLRGRKKCIGIVVVVMRTWKSRWRWRD